ncbi:MAG: ABC transporter substrate-binding protein [Candidatus Omnitrophota bacterium]
MLSSIPLSRRHFLSVSSGAALWTACGGDDSSYSGSFFSPSPDPKILVLYDMNDPPTLDPARSWGVFDGTLIGLVFSKLVCFDSKAAIQPDLASDWTIDEGGKRYTFRLHPAARFSNGRPIIADDVKYSFERVLDPRMASSSQWVLERIKRMEIADDRTITLVLEEPYAPFLGLLAMPAASIVPREEVERCEREGVPFGERPLGGGPWIFQEWKHDRHLLFHRNDNYCGVKPNMAKLKMRIIGNPFTAVAEFEIGNIAAINPLPLPEVPRWIHHPQWKRYVELYPLLNIDMLVINCERPPFDNAETRRAFAHSIETPLVLQCVRAGAGTISRGPIPPGLPGYSENLPLIPYDLDKAQSIIQKTNLRDRILDIVFPYNEDYIRSTGEVIQALWKKLGIRVRLQQLEWVTYRKYLREGNFDMAWRNWYADYPDGDNFLYPLFHSSQVGSGNMSRFRDAEADALIERSQRELDSEKRRALLEQANELLYRKTPAIFMWHQAKYAVHQPWLEGYSEPLIFNGTRYLKERIVETALP